MAYVISDSCVMCGACEGECPVSAISEGEGQYVIDADTCIDCGSCEATCPTGAISMQYNQEGFLVPKIDLNKCIQCGA